MEPASLREVFPLVEINTTPIKWKVDGWVATKQDRFLEMAMGVACTSKCKMRHGAVVVRHGHVLGASPNLYKNSPKYVDFHHSQVHAEVAALRKAGWPTKATIYVARVNGSGESRLSQPCANCAEVLRKFKCKAVWTI